MNQKLSIRLKVIHKSFIYVCYNTGKSRLIHFVNNE